ncbi:hypothetical protein, conserved [Trypanosoma brucei brucei TREU927]|uniref:Enriched in surface-labeled proteome protein 12 n=1 Tax=Trypanosoma brucei brucei (strain 927/4 GUTat10.1) TaxID=185431 RepID=Q57UQ3_TRYB2|nr:hypothetical protein, conserved [Trypanosoma brucei brucei TREU927]AAX70666.1 hypothetical protein, conserved [Trypanosoma brucei]AAZ12487.1 hypothetical protein, conserved [Trypanosoma brucei brucei TREU927]
MVMKAFPLSLLAATTVLLLLLPVPGRCADCFAHSNDYSTPGEPFGKSKHTITLSGGNWGTVIGSDGNALKTALLLDIYAQILRRHAFNTSVTVDDMRQGEHGMEAEVTVTQVLLTDVPRADLQHTWNPNEITSLLMQGVYKHTKDKHDPHSDVHLVSVRLPAATTELHKCGKACWTVRLIGIFIGIAMILIAAYTIFITRKWEKQAEKEPDDDSSREPLPEQEQRRSRTRV